MDIPSSVCRRLARINPAYRYGIGFLPGQGQIAFLAMLVDRRHAGSDNADHRPYLTSHVKDLGDRLVKLYDRDGGVPCVVPSDKAAVILSWPGQENSFGNAAIVNGDHAAWLEFNGKPKYEIDSERTDWARNHGRDLDRYVESAADDLADYWLHQGNKETGRDPLFDKVAEQAAWKSVQGQKIARIAARDKRDSFEEFVMIENGVGDKL